MSSTNGTRSQRRTLIVDSKMQKAFVVDVALVPATAMAVTTLIVALFCQRLGEEADTFDIGLTSLVPLFISVVCFVMASGFAIVFQAIKMSNRVAGPQINIKRVINQVIAGDPNVRVRLRKGDFMISAADDINRLIDHFTGATTPNQAGANHRAAVPQPDPNLEEVPAAMSATDAAGNPGETVGASR